MGKGNENSLKKTNDAGQRRGTLALNNDLTHSPDWASESLPGSSAVANNFLEELDERIAQNLADNKPSDSYGPKRGFSLNRGNILRRFEVHNGTKGASLFSALRVKQREAVPISNSLPPSSNMRIDPQMGCIAEKRKYMDSSHTKTTIMTPESLDSPHKAVTSINRAEKSTTFANKFAIGASNMEGSTNSSLDAQLSRDAKGQVRTGVLPVPSVTHCNAAISIKRRAEKAIVTKESAGAASNEESRRALPHNLLEKVEDQVRPGAFSAPGPAESQHNGVITIDEEERDILAKTRPAAAAREEDIEGPLASMPGVALSRDLIAGNQVRPGAVAVPGPSAAHHGAAISRISVVSRKGVSAKTGDANRIEGPPALSQDRTAGNQVRPGAVAVAGPSASSLNVVTSNRVAERDITANMAILDGGVLPSDIRPPCGLIAVNQRAQPGVAAIPGSSSKPPPGAVTSISRAEMDIRAKTQCARQAPDTENVPAPVHRARLSEHSDGTQRSEAQLKQGHILVSGPSPGAVVSPSQAERDILAKTQAVSTTRLVPSSSVPPELHGSAPNGIARRSTTTSLSSGLESSQVHIPQNEQLNVTETGLGGQLVSGGPSLEQSEALFMIEQVSAQSSSFRAEWDTIESARGREVHFDTPSATENDWYMNAPDQSLTVAAPVNQREVTLDIPVAIEIDIDVKPSPRRRRRRCLPLVFFVATASLLVACSIAFGVMVGGKGGGQQAVAPTLAPTLNRESTNIRDLIQGVVGYERLAEPDGPYARALDWLILDDPLKLTLSNKTLYQRYFAAYLYLATSKEKPWASCSPPAPDGLSSCDQIVFRYNNMAFSPFEDVSYEPIISWRWMSELSECLWAGIVCDNQGQIRSIVLWGQNMTGSFPDGIQFFPYLQRFTAFYGGLRGTLSPEFASLKSMNSLILRSNELSGTIPVEIWSMPSLQAIDLGANLFSGTFPAEMTRIRDIKSSILHNNKFQEGTIPTEVGFLRSAFYIFWDATNFRGTIPTQIGHCRALHRLGLSNNKLTGTIPTEIGQLQIAAHLVLQKNLLTGPIPSEIFRLRALVEMNLGDNQLTGNLSTLVGTMPNLMVLNVESNRLSGPIPSELAQIPVLRFALLHGNAFNGTMPTAICEHRSNIFIELAADCLPDPNTDLVQLACPSDCCSSCYAANMDNLA